MAAMAQWLALVLYVGDIVVPCNLSSWLDKGGDSALRRKWDQCQLRVVNFKPKVTYCRYSKIVDFKIQRN